MLADIMICNGVSGSSGCAFIIIFQDILTLPASPDTILSLYLLRIKQGINIININLQFLSHNKVSLLENIPGRTSLKCVVWSFSIRVNGIKFGEWSQHLNIVLSIVSYSFLFSPNDSTLNYKTCQFLAWFSPSKLNAV